MKRYLSLLTFLTLSLYAQNDPLYSETVQYELRGDADFSLDAALDDYAELTRCEEDAKEQMDGDAMAEADLCETHNIDIRLAHPIEIRNIRVTGRSISNTMCSLEAVYTLSTLPPEEMEAIGAICKEEDEGYGASLMLDDGLWQALQFGFGVGYSEGGVADMQQNNEGPVFAYRYVGAPAVTADAAYLYKLPIANLYALVGGELGWVIQQKNTLSQPTEKNGEWEDGGSPYIFRVGINAGAGYRFHMRYDIQAQVGYQFQYLYRTTSSLRCAVPIIFMRTLPPG